ncbi:GTP pyrophosphokinase [Spiroplasma syrphidicola EA-1]|uniref:Penta-phosphate guanosine-3'-pyrophosphohydrolase n=1 Tax=Spiroplasma syrphidicola EA-1 TaxID=1276229 RepID=R4UJ80_9MOLU|nr:RelA/SpoT family protein [Spiroplasma syrphidicola]AGM26180.1 GTP pyrophosphokinase [Spiroplasma syrphidicola EA-1]
MDQNIKFEDVLAQIKLYIKDEKSLNEIVKAYEFAEEKHRGQIRKSGAPYIIHPLWTTFFLAQWKMGPKTLIAGLLHDVFEDTPATYEEMQKLFGLEITNLVEAVTKVSYFAKENRTQIKAQYLRKLYLSMAKDIRVIIIKLADRLHNLRTINFLSPERQQIIAKESLEIYSAIAHRLGMKAVKSEIEDLSFKILNPQEYNKIITLLETSNKERENTINKKIEELKDILINQKKMDVKIYGRSKSIYSIHRKMNQFGKNFDDIHDILAVRIITNSIDDCYKVLGFVHQQYTPLNNRFKDYIATPKHNLYQSLHTTIAAEDGSIFEVQIRTEEMDEIAEQGVAAHWRYKEGENYDVQKKQKDIDDRLDIFKRILDLENLTVHERDEIQQEVYKPDQVMEEIIQNDIFASLVYVLTPNGKVVTLPFGSTVLDFAYKIHSEIGEKTIGAKINGLFSPIATVLKSGDVVDIKTSVTQKPNHSWLVIAKTSSAVQKIRKYLKKELVETSGDLKTQNLEKIKTAKAQIEEYIGKKDLKYKLVDADTQLERLREIDYTNIEDFLLDVANDEYTIEEAVNLIYYDPDTNQNQKILKKLQDKKYKKAQLKDDIIVQGITSIKVIISQCCLPIPYEDIVGYVSKSEGIKVHLKECHNIQSEDKQERQVDVVWNELVCKNKQYDCGIRIEAIDRPALLADITKVLSHLNASIQMINANTSSDLMTISIKLIIKVANVDRLRQIRSSLLSIPDIKTVERILM